MKIPTNETVLRENLHEAVESLSLVNIIILLVLIRAVQVISWLRPGERDIKSLPDPTVGPVLDETPPMAVGSEWPTLPAPSFGTLPENYPSIASITQSSGPEPGSGEITVQDRDGRDWTFSEWMAYQRRSVVHETNRRAYEQLDREIWNGNQNVSGGFPGLLNDTQREPLHWEHTGVDHSRHRRYATVTPSGEPAYHAAILAWAFNDCLDQLVLIRRPSGEFRIERDHRQNVKGDKSLIMAPQYPLEVLETECDRANHLVGQCNREDNRYGLYAGPMGYCTPSRVNMITGGFGVSEPIFYGSPRSREIATEYERRTGQLQNGRHTGPIHACGGVDGTGPHIRARCQLSVSETDDTPASE